MGSTPHAHAQANVKHAHDQGVVAMIGVFIDTFVVLTLNALVIICTLYTKDGILATGVIPEGIGKTNLAQTAFGSVFGASLGAKFVAVCLLFFAFSTILSWNLFGKINADYLFGKMNGKVCSVIYTIIALVFIFLGTVSGSDFVWEVTDMFNNFIVLPNVIALFALTGMVVASLNEVKKDKLKVYGINKPGRGGSLSPLSFERSVSKKIRKKRNKGLTFWKTSAILYKSAAPTTRCGGIAQLGERLNGIQEVSGSIPLISTTETRHTKVCLVFCKGEKYA